jgi:acyl phosphate:glycerol-3-phosphate acyltransferase
MASATALQSATPLTPLLALVIAYVAGSIPSAYLAGKARGVDLRQHGSGNLGATNVVRVLGPKIGAAVFVADVLKGFLPVFFLPRYTATTLPYSLLALALGAVAILGHVKPIFLLGKGGGKGVATAAGVFWGLAWSAMLITTVVWALVFWIWRYVSLASLAAAATLPVSLLLTGMAPKNPIFIASVVIALFVFYTHRANIGRLRRGEEHSFRRTENAA